MTGKSSKLLNNTNGSMGILYCYLIFELLQTQQFKHLSRDLDSTKFDWRWM